MSNSPFTVQELVDHCISFLQDSMSDLRACSLVARSWVYPAQAHLFRDSNLTNSDLTVFENCMLWIQFSKTLHSSPHLIRHMRHLNIELHVAPLSPLSRICAFPFTHVQSVSIKLTGGITEPCALALQRLFSLPTLCRVTLKCSAISENFMQIWERCSPTIRHVDLSCTREKEIRFPLPSLTLYRGAPLKLESLSMQYLGTFDSQLIHAPGPFDLWHLKMLRLGSKVGAAWQELAPKVQRLETLDIVADRRPKALILADFLVASDNSTHPSPQIPLTVSMFPKIRQLRIIFPATATQIVIRRLLQQTLSGIGHSSMIRTITIATDPPAFLDHDTCELLDSLLSGLPMPNLPTLELDMDPLGYDGTILHLPRMASRNLVVCVPPG
ncbi:hypothetical protein MVEN_00292700 [Mycena venus]|uniref:Uncharacterized protein n=1 Tax=Mycena venus TaxID=2733690 RepID=A0A8H6Z338_9AGAR|nr:hypothetical protein MVEN_00292700 [Mycena venus]